MGCALSKVHKRFIETTKKGHPSVSIEIVDIYHLNDYFTDDDNPNPKCIFIFGGSGSNKGEFIWQLLQMNSDSESDDSLVYHYIDVEKLILDNIGKRIKRLTQDKTAVNQANNLAVDLDHNGHERCLSGLSGLSDAICLNSTSIDDLKTKLLLYANIVTNSWVLGLITKEIDKLSVDSIQRVFIINMIPNRMNIFRNCLFLKQAPSFVNFHFNYIAINLIHNASKRKDLDQLALTSGYDEVNLNFINYFRLVNKLIDIKAEINPIKIKIKITKNSKNAIKIECQDDLLSFIYTPKKDGMEVDINGLKMNKDLSNNKSENGLMFLISNEIEVDDSQVFVFEENNFNVQSVRKFTQYYYQLRDSVIKSDPKESD